MNRDALYTVYGSTLNRGDQQMRIKAIQNGSETFAEKREGRWFVGGDRPWGVVSILLERDGRPAWFRLKGCFLKFEDFE